MSRSLARHLSQGTSSAKAKTELVFLHQGLPRTEYYAKELLKHRAAEYYYIPQLLQRFIPETFLVNERVRSSVHKYGETQDFQDSLVQLAEKVETSLSRLIPESGPFLVSNIINEKEHSVQKSIEDIKKRRSENLIFLPLYSHYWCGEGGLLLNKIASNFVKSTVPLVRNGKEVHSSRIFQNSDFSFDISTIARWNDHPVVSDIWASKLASSTKKFDGIVFAAPRKIGYNKTEYERSLWASCERVMQRLDHAFPWKLAFYNSWDSWDLVHCHSVPSAVKSLEGAANDRKVAVVPVAEVIPTFDTVFTLPKILEPLETAHLIIPDDASEKLAQGLSELVKNHLLGRRHRQLEVKCDHCIRSDCSDRDIFL